jgi:hypothetical protein
MAGVRAREEDNSSSPGKWRLVRLHTAALKIWLKRHRLSFLTTVRWACFRVAGTADPPGARDHFSRRRHRSSRATRTHIWKVAARFSSARGVARIASLNSYAGILDGAPAAPHAAGSACKLTATFETRGCSVHSGNSSLCRQGWLILPIASKPRSDARRPASTWEPGIPRQAPYYAAYLKFGTG